MQNGHTVDVAIVESKNIEPYNYESVNVFPLLNGIEGFIQLVKQQYYDICHFQEYSGKNGIHIEWFQIAKKCCRKVLFTFHLPYFTCYKMDFRFFGVEDCNNFTSLDRCAKCIIATKLHYRKADGFNLINYGINSIIPFIEKTNKVRLLKTNIKNNTNHLQEVLSYCDHIFVIADWFKKLLEYNGFSSSKISYIPSVIHQLRNDSRSDRQFNMKLVFIGRIEPQKGLHVLCKAMKSMSDAKIELDVFGNVEDEEYLKKCQKEFKFNFKGAILRKDLLSKLNDYDFLMLPSVCTEMHPLVLQEAMGSNLPVIASAAKGNLEFVKEGKNGFIFNYDDYKDLASVIDKAYSLKKDGWQPEFEMNDSHESDLKEILSYYS